MTQHTDLIERLRCFDRVTCNEAADALESQSREIAALKEQVEGLRKDAERLNFIEAAPEGCVRMDAGFCPSYLYWGTSDYYKEARRNDAGNFCGPTLRAVLDAAIAAKGGA